MKKVNEKNIYKYIILKKKYLYDILFCSEIQLSSELLKNKNQKLKNTIFIIISEISSFEFFNSILWIISKKIKFYIFDYHKIKFENNLIWN